MGKIALFLLLAGILMAQPIGTLSTVAIKVRDLDSSLKFFTELYRYEFEGRQSSYRGFSVMDTQGNTVEVYTTPKEKPASGDWPGE